jgi:hypothetical protein
VAVVDEEGRFLGEVYASTIIASMIQEQGVDEDAGKERQSETDGGEVDSGDALRGASS